MHNTVAAIEAWLTQSIINIRLELRPSLLTHYNDEHYQKDDDDQNSTNSSTHYRD